MYIKLFNYSIEQKFESNIVSVYVMETRCESKIYNECYCQNTVSCCGEYVNEL
ncbi:hypothetical protein J15TS10_33410 [Paenibacillus woosongensis]|uniref:Uncharacterized protein n=1 Tax=Paenibacillus woosongensis TaxID=307580 RepID=A0ABQ4MUC7_9BACL|nr:hypothetical protein J15TS10_33410 [Paenibacillus woosongensis]